VRRSFLRRLPRPVRWLWYAILGLLAAELVLLALGVAVGRPWLQIALQLSSILVGPAALGILIVVAVGVWANRAPAPSDQEPRALPGPDVPPEVAAVRATSQAVIALARTPEGKRAIRQGARLLRAVRAATRPAHDEDDAGA
jgi:hypothetical protein